jgi:hypothetical protein
MKKCFSFLLCLALPLLWLVMGSMRGSGDCNMAVSYAEMAAKNFKSASTSDSMDGSQELINKGVEQATEAAAYAINSQCNCPNAKNYALNAVTFGKKALKATNIKDRNKMAKKAMDMCYDVVSATAACK